MENKQTAVEWLINQIGKHLEINKEEGMLIIEQAKAMEKEQIKRAYNCGVDWRHISMDEYYYNETYNKKDDA